MPEKCPDIACPIQQFLVMRIKSFKKLEIRVFTHFSYMGSRNYFFFFPHFSPLLSCYTKFLS
jgi:hypothetical protein